MRKRMGGPTAEPLHGRMRHSLMPQLLSGLDFLESWEVCRHRVPGFMAGFTMLGEARSFTSLFSLFLKLKCFLCKGKNSEGRGDYQGGKISGSLPLITQTAYFGLCLGNWKESCLLQGACDLSHTSL